MSAIARYFELKGRGTTVATELRGAVATFLTMSYIIAVNPGILKDAGVPLESAIACTAAAAGICCILMGLGANFPIAMASGMGLNAIVAYQIAREAGSWQTAMGLIVIDGLLILILVICGLREAVMNAIPRDLRRAIGAGIGLFIAFIGAVNAKLVIVPAGTIATLSKNPAAAMPPVGYGNLRAPETAIAVAGLLITAFLMARRARGAILIGILASTAIALVAGLAQFPPWDHLARPPSFANAFQANVVAALSWHLLPLLLAFMMVDFFDTLGTVTAISEQAGLQDDRGQIPGLRRILMVDAIGASIGGLFGASSVTAYVESAAGVAEGARTGLHTVFVGLMFLVAVFLAPVVAIVPLAATAPALILVGFLMCLEIGRIDFKDPEIGIPAFIIIVTLPFTYSISHGIGYGFITYTAIKVFSGRFREVHPLMYAVSAAFAAYFLWGS
jgi:AGZA family xanthine/uracil permease-like MFS transporter